MTTTRIFKNGNSQAVRIPAELAYERSDLDVEIERVGDEIRIRQHAARSPACWQNSQNSPGLHGRRPRRPRTSRERAALMPRYMLDTNICIYLMKNQPKEVALRFEQCSVGDVVISAITYAELQFGVAMSADSEREHANVESLIEDILVVPFDAAASIAYGLSACHPR